ncbi:MAG: aldo/keto reductase, partial [Candidatus Eremiobacteraeota bacterium]|nr:aldo/keto reductase [Candidatus Eremiobacteraeota bacterium]
DIADGDFRELLPRFQGAAFDANQKIVEQLGTIAQRVGATPGQIALAWILATSPVTVPIPGTKHVAYVEENAGAANVQLSPDDLSELNGLASPTGARY